LRFPLEFLINIKCNFSYKLNHKLKVTRFSNVANYVSFYLSDLYNTRCYIVKNVKKYEKVDND